MENFLLNIIPMKLSSVLVKLLIIFCNLIFQKYCIYLFHEIEIDFLLVIFTINYVFHINIREPSPVSSPAKRPTQRTQRKRRRKDEALNKNTSKYNTFIHKPFKRSMIS